MTAWAVQTATDGLGSWLVELSDGADARVIAPPGVALDPGSEIAGWRLACWGTTDGGPASLDSERPWTVRTISTRAVLELLPAEDHQFVLDTLVTHLATARRVAVPLPGEAIVEDLARIGAQAAAWAERELADAFPELVWPQRDLGAPYPLAPLLELDPPAAFRQIEAEASAIPSRRPQSLVGFLLDWLRWLLARYLPRVYDALRRRHLIVGDRPVRAPSPGVGPHGSSRKSDAGELARL